MKEDEQLKKLDKKSLDRVIKLLDLMYAKESKRLARAIKTAKTKVESVKLRITKKQKKQTN